jgi:hypothetical protein
MADGWSDAYSRWRAESAPTGPPSSVRPAPGVMLRRLSGPLNALLANGTLRQAPDGVIELVVNAEEAREGGMVTISMRVPIPCPACTRTPQAPCRRCGNKRTVDELFSAWLAVRPGVADQTILHPSALLAGMRESVRFRVRLPSRK